MIRRPPRSTQGVSSAASDVYKRQAEYMGEFSDQRFASDSNTLRYIRAANMNIVFLFKRNLIYICVGVGDYSYSCLKMLLEALHIQLVSMITEKPNTQLTNNPSLDVKSYLDGEKTDQTLAMSLKFSARTVCSYLNGFPVLRMSIGIRVGTTKIFLKHKPEDMLFGCIIAGNSFVTIARESDIIISPTDMNALLNTILVNPIYKKFPSAFALCLPGIADDGYLYFTIKYATPNICIVYACLGPEYFYQCLGKANAITEELAAADLLKGITKALKHSLSLPMPDINPKVRALVIKHNLQSQISIMNLPPFADSSETRSLLRNIHSFYQSSENPGCEVINFEYINHFKGFVLYLSVTEGKTFLFVCKGSVDTVSLKQMRDRTRKTVELEEAQFFIPKY
eukprot:TRINITY_DN11873_c0_g1_i2.p1 TRINITY_DN11873_c0_g1~~TRINITY_DN11873_c0_g1_i2.p1  ORF type:complete len:396 (-),score=45.85 TRINITY_DN11873_c0_g1_i2:16-1203(-)